MLAPVSAPQDASAGSPSRGAGEPTLDVLLACDLQLIAEAVAAALSSRDFHTTVLDWPHGSLASLQRELRTARAHVAVLLYDVDMSIRMATAHALLRAWSGPWLVLTGAASGPAWGGLRIAGASAVRPSDIPLAEVESLIRRLARGGADPAAAGMVRQVAAWQDIQARHGQLQRRLDSLTPRQLQVLTLLHQGVQVEEIARRLGLSEGTVRSQVQAVLRKLGVRAQLAAVAMLHAIERPV